jgi:hypothetical protein
MNVADKIGKIVDGNAVVADVRGDNVGRQGQKRIVRASVFHKIVPEHLTMRPPAGRTRSR